MTCIFFRHTPGTSRAYVVVCGRILAMPLATVSVCVCVLINFHDMNDGVRRICNDFLEIVKDFG